ncbi:MAG: hypothetical protein GYB53_22180 [Rhodobacteraceae bacterium]|nr:hypothetical protein [Paracoccaceae bacterium]MBR9823713.1 hypothetical protein [Paracoccaceae bacterium]
MARDVTVYDGPAVRALYGQLVRDFGGVEAAAALLGCGKGTVSREVNGSLPVAISHFCALEDELGRFPISTMLMQRSEASRAAQAPLGELMQRVVAENGDVARLVVKALCGGGETGSLAKELREAIEAQQQLLDQVEREESR